MADIFNMIDTWNDAGVTFSAIKMDVTDTASAAGSNLLDLQVGGVSRFRVSKTGNVEVPNGAYLGGAFAHIKSAGSRCDIIYGGRSAYFDGTTFKITGGGNQTLYVSEIALGDRNETDNTFLSGDLNLLEQRNGTASQTFNIYNTYTDASNYERARMGWNANAYEIKPEAAGTGTVRELHISGLPTTDPAISGVLWNDAGTVKVSA